jgi:uncharacterized protein YndB with AHSA1/START domain
MKALKAILFTLAAIIALALIAALFIEKEYAVEREITINKPVSEVFDYIKYLKNQDSYSKWNTMDPNMKHSYTGTDGTVGFIAAWEGNKNFGVGEQEIMKIIEGERIETQLRFKEPFEAQDDAYMTTTMIDSTTTKVIWGFSGAFAYPMNLMKLIMNMEEQLGSDFETGLQNLKEILEKE